MSDMRTQGRDLMQQQQQWLYEARRELLLLLYGREKKIEFPNNEVSACARDGFFEAPSVAEPGNLVGGLSVSVYRRLLTISANSRVITFTLKKKLWLNSI